MMNSREQQAFEILRVMARTAAEGKSLTIAKDCGFGTATVIDQDGAHTHVGFDGGDEQRALEAFVGGLHDLLVQGRGLSWAKPSNAELIRAARAQNETATKASACMRGYTVLFRLWAFLTGQKLVALKDYDGEVTIVPAYKTPFGYVAKRYWPSDIRNVLLKDDGTVDNGVYVMFWKDV